MVVVLAAPKTSAWRRVNDCIGLSPSNFYSMAIDESDSEFAILQLQRGRSQALFKTELCLRPDRT
jgi:hypothetical protein